MSVLLVDAADDVASGATKGNSGVIHAGYNEENGSVRAKFCWAGNQMFPQLDKELRFGFSRNGSLVVAFNEDDLKMLDRLKHRGEVNGVKNLRIVLRDELLQMEPHLNPAVIAALYAPDAGSVIPFEYAIALAENAVDNGVELRLRREVTAISKKDDGWILELKHWEPKSFLDSSVKAPEFGKVEVGDMVRMCI